MWNPFYIARNVVHHSGLPKTWANVLQSTSYLVVFFFNTHTPAGCRLWRLSQDYCEPMSDPCLKKELPGDMLNQFKKSWETCCCKVQIQIIKKKTFLQPGSVVVIWKKVMDTPLSLSVVDNGFLQWRSNGIKCPHFSLCQWREFEFLKVPWTHWFGSL